MAGSKTEAATVAATAGQTAPRVEIVSDRRRRHEMAFRAQVVAEALKPGAQVQDVARRHGICPSLVYRWRRARCAGREDGPALHLLPVRITSEPEQAVAPATPALAETAAPGPSRAGLIEIEFAGGERVRVEESVSLAALRRVIAAVRG